MISETLAQAIETLTGTGKRFALIHEAAVTAYGINMNIVPYGVDAWAPEAEDMAGVIAQVDDTPVRVRKTLPGLGPDRFDEHVIWNKAYGAYVIRPELCLRYIVLSPDIEYLWEQRAALAMVLLADRMTDAERMEYDRHVRGI